MAITERQAVASQQIGGTNERQRDERQENDMEMQTTSTAATRFILQARPTLLAGLRVVPVAMLLIGAASAAAPAGAPDASRPPTSRSVAARSPTRPRST